MATKAETRPKGYPETPELDKQGDIIKTGANVAVQDFIDWLNEKGLVIAERLDYRWESCTGVKYDWMDDSNCSGGSAIHTRTGKHKYPENSPDTKAGEECPLCEGKGEVQVERSEPRYEPIMKRPEQLMADHFEIDLDKIETERRAILDYLSNRP